MAIYFIQAGPGGPIKIGTAADPSSRARELQVGNHEHLTIIRTIEGGLDAEMWLAEFFAPLHIRGEWFRFDEQMLSIEVPPIPPKRRLLPLQSFLEQNSIDAEDFARLIGTSTEAVYTYLRRTRIPRMKVLAAIVRETRGAVTANDFYLPGTAS